MSLTLHTAFKLPYCASELNRGTQKERWKKGKENKEQRKMAVNPLVTLPMMHSAVHPPALVRADEINHSKTARRS
jgi:hypothetical protein